MLSNEYSFYANSSSFFQSSSVKKHNEDNSFFKTSDLKNLSDILPADIIYVNEAQPIDIIGKYEQAIEIFKLDQFAEDTFQDHVIQLTKYFHKCFIPNKDRSQKVLVAITNLHESDIQTIKKFAKDLLQCGNTIHNIIYNIVFLPKVFGDSKDLYDIMMVLFGYVAKHLEGILVQLQGKAKQKNIFRDLFQTAADKWYIILLQYYSAINNILKLPQSDMDNKTVITLPNDQQKMIEEMNKSDADTYVPGNKIYNRQNYMYFKQHAKGKKQSKWHIKEYILLFIGLICLFIFLFLLGRMILKRIKIDRTKPILEQIKTIITSIYSKKQKQKKNKQKKRKKNKRQKQKKKHSKKISKIIKKK